MREQKIAEKVERILSFNPDNNTKLSQSTMTHEEHSHLIFEVLEEDVPHLLSELQTLQQKNRFLRQEIERKNDVITTAAEQMHSLQQDRDKLIEGLKGICKPKLLGIGSDVYFASAFQHIARDLLEEIGVNLDEANG